MSPNHFLILGAQKAGTTALHSFLAEHPEIAMSAPKETNHFLHRETTPSPYLACFPEAAGKAWCGEASPIYLLRCQEVAPRIAAALPGARLIASLRNPIQRAYSQFHMLVQIGKASGSFSTALQEALQVPSLAAVAFDPQTGYPIQPVQTLLLYGQYCQQIQCFRRYFDDSQLLWIRHEDLLNAHAPTLQRIFAFLDLEPVAIQARPVHQRRYPPLTRPIWEQLHAILRPEIDALEGLLGWDLSLWKQP